MILKFNRVEREETELRDLFGTQSSVGTCWEKAKKGLNKLGFDFIFPQISSIVGLETLLKQGVPVIVSLDIFHLGFGSHQGHSVVVVGVGEDSIIVNDPLRGRNLKIDYESFFKAWRERGFLAGYIKRK